ncbi:E3 ubiquitin- ligase RNF213-like [Chlorella sorokiniana]|uniref:E3 ubiquitin-ligase RNF213-like n=1 Tax=Chlorella sorokiniana TaxID=3076 RepID=A0A2P6TPA6_CHLSO|nr:E3 ubiquitin- ligase RNF213-like [Chlorella sorokiniana]|eukprot:PRW51170.1 E3 ubiquitin- ligase RNF213-like [Chlorella sorokiniana]
MAAQSWAEWLSGLVSGLWPRLTPQPGSHEARLEEMRVSALLDKELRKPAGQRDEELVHKLRVERRKLGLANAQASRRVNKYGAYAWDRHTRTCCGAAQWATQRIAASYHALADFYEQVVQQMAEDLAAAEARRQPIIAAQPTLHLELPEALQQPPPRLDMCSECAKFVQQGQRPPSQQQQRQQQHDCGGSGGGGAEGSPTTPKQQQPSPPPPQHSSSDEEQR